MERQTREVKGKGQRRPNTRREAERRANRKQGNPHQRALRRILKGSTKPLRSTWEHLSQLI